jgi:D-alanine-D-alanine ligase
LSDPADLARVDSSSKVTGCWSTRSTTLPGFTPASDFPKLWQASGIEPPALCQELLASALERFRTDRAGHMY